MDARKPSGVSGLDSLLKGGFPPQSCCLIVGMPGSGKSTLVRQFVFNSLTLGEKCIFITTTEPVSAIIGQMKMLNLDIGKFVGKSLVFIDCYSWRLDEEMREKEKYQIPSISNLNQIGLMLSQAIKELNVTEKGGVIVLDSLSDFLLHSDPNSIFKLLQLITGRIKSVNSVGLFTIEEGLHDAKQIATVNYIADSTILMKLEIDKRFLRIERMMDTVHPLNWIEFRIEKGLEIKLEEFFR